ncbi:MAG TPA: hypothetical protein PKC14_04695, partial [Candidatus Absconditabacterales bacterium]|nr:hypothetical protein [Candidatus Absconditabacterales bacterium]
KETKEFDWVPQGRRILRQPTIIETRKMYDYKRLEFFGFLFCVNDKFDDQEKFFIFLDERTIPMI